MGDVGAILFGRPDRFFEAQPLGMNKSPDRPDVCLDPTRCQFPRQLAQGEWPRANALQRAAEDDKTILVDGTMNANSATKPRMIPIKNLAKNGPVGVL
jgi:hypothetical protein